VHLIFKKMPHCCVGEKCLCSLPIQLNNNQPISMNRKHDRCQTELPVDVRDAVEETLSSLDAHDSDMEHGKKMK